jgi:outer membrane lipoprotein LolB
MRNASINLDMLINKMPGKKKIGIKDGRNPFLFVRFLFSVFRSRAGAGVLLLALLFLSACSSTEPRIADESAGQLWQERRAQLDRLDRWELQGRIGFVSEHESGSASLYWMQDRDSYEIKIVAPLGMGSLVVTGDKNGAVLQSSDGEMLQAEDAQWLVWQGTGWVIPMASLRYWILGLPLENEKYHLSKSGYVSDIKSDAWQVEYQRYQAVQGYELPRNLHIYNPELKIKLVIKNWRLY